MLAGSALITVSSIAYFDFETLPPFVVEKLPLRFESLYLTALRVHVASTSLAFPLCLVLLTRFLRRHLAWHRWIGRFTGALILFALVPSGSFIAFQAKGGALGTAGFLLTGAIVAWNMARGILDARRRDRVSHRRAMYHVVAQMSVAVVSRALMLALDAAGVDPDRAYLLALWAPVLGAVLAVELITQRGRLFRPSLRSLRAEPRLEPQAPIGGLQ